MRELSNIRRPICIVSTMMLLMALTVPDESTAWLSSVRFSTNKNMGVATTSASRPFPTGRRMLQDDDEQQSHQHKNNNIQSSSSSSSDVDDHHHNPTSGEAALRNVTQEVLKKVRVAKAQAEIDRILQGPDPPFDTEAELEKVISMSHIPSEQPLLDAEMAQLESELYQAVKQEDFTLASIKKEELGQLQQESGNGMVDDGGAILQVNAAFYRAFSQKSWEDMEKVWLRHDGDTSVCIHPSHKPLVGSRRISKSWKQMFASTDGSFQRSWMEPHDIRMMLKGNHMAIVTCEEHVYARRFVRGKKRQTELINKLQATNIFRKVEGKWYMVYHHASWHQDSEAAKRALSGDGNGGKGGKVVESKPTSSLAADLAARRRRRRRQMEDMDDDEDDEEAENGMKGILGNDFGPILGDDKPKERPQKRIIMGASLSDILNGGLGDLLGDGNDGNNNNGAQNDNPNDLGLPQEGAIIQFSRIDEDGNEIHDGMDMLVEGMDEEEEGHDHDGEDDEGIDHEGESVAIIKEWAKSSSQASKRNNKGKRNGNQKNDDDAAAADKQNEKVFKDALRQNCISALRKLAEQGTIAPKQKRVLLTDIITCSSKGEFSMVEVAYELLCGEGDANDQEAAEEEFAEQCRVFAQELLLKQESEML